METEPVPFGYVGCGFVAQRIHIPNFASLPACRFLALAELREGLGRRVAARYSIPTVYGSHLQLAADPNIRAVGVSAPYALQGRIAEDLLRAGKHVFMEKPMAVSVERAEAILAAAKSGGGRLMIGYMKRYDPGNLLLRARIRSWRESGDYGRILLARNHGFGGDWVYAQDPSVPFENSDESAPDSPDDAPQWLPADSRRSYLGFLQQWTHNLNLLRFFLEREPGETRLVDAMLDEDGMTGLTVLDIGGVRAVVESGYSRFHAWEEHTQVYFEGGWLRTQAPPLMQKGAVATVESYESRHDGQEPRATFEYAAPRWAYREEASAFLECIRTGEAFPSSGEDTIHDVRLVEEIYRRRLGLR